MVIGRVRWQANAQGLTVLEALAGEGIDPARYPGLPVKENPLRSIYRLATTLDDRPAECFIKRYNESSLEGRVKRLLRGPAASIEWRHTRYAEAAGVPVPPPLACGVASGVSYLLTRSCLPAENLDIYLERAEWTEATGRSLARLLATTHAAGILHRDLHAGNVLCRPAPDATGEPTLWLLDLQKVRLRRGPGGRPLSPRAVAGNLAVLVAGLRPWVGQDQLGQLLADYLGASQTIEAHWLAVDPGLFIESVQRAADRHVAAQLRSRDRAILRTGRYFAKIRGPGLWRGGMFLRRRRPLPNSPASTLQFSPQNWLALLSDPASLISDQVGPGEQVVKQSEAGLVARRVFTIGPHRVVVFVKHYRWRRRWAAVADLFRKSRARRAFKVGHQLLARDVPTALPLAHLERRVGRVLIESILITEAVPDSMHLEQFVTRELANLPEAPRVHVRQMLARELGRAIARMHRAGWVQRDMKAPNVMVQYDPGEDHCRITFIDLDGLRPGPRDRFRPLVRLNDGFFAATAVTLSDRLRVLRSYLGDANGWKGPWRTIHQATLARRRSRIGPDRPGPAP